MQCRFGINTMTSGKLMGLRRLAWSEQGKRRWALYEKEGEVTLATGIDVAKIEAFRCKQCRKVIIDVDSER